MDDKASGDSAASPRIFDSRSSPMRLLDMGGPIRIERRLLKAEGFVGAYRMIARPGYAFPHHNVLLAEASIPGEAQA